MNALEAPFHLFLFSVKLWNCKVIISLQVRTEFTVNVDVPGYSYSLQQLQSDLSLLLKIRT